MSNKTTFCTTCGKRIGFDLTSKEEFCQCRPMSNETAQPDNICDFCIHFCVFRNKLGTIIDGIGYCGLKRKSVDDVDTCKNYFGKRDYKRWRKNA